MRPVDALLLPRARLTDKQRKAVAKAVEILESLYEPYMTRSGICINMRCDDLVVLHELERHCRNEGWVTQVAPDWEPPRVQGGSVMLRGFKMTLTPPREVYIEVDAETLQ